MAATDPHSGMRGDSGAPPSSIRRLWQRVAASNALLAIRPLLDWFLSYFFLVLATVFLVGVAGNWLLWQLGLPDLFWHEQWLRQLLAGFGVGMFLTNAGVIGFLLASREPWTTELRRLWQGFGSNSRPNDSPRNKAARETDDLVVRYLLLTTCPLLAALLLTTLRAPDHLRWFQRTALPFGAVVGAIVALWGIWGTRWLAVRAMERGTWIGRQIAKIDGPGGHAPNWLVAFQRKHRTRKAAPAGVEDFHRAAAVFFIGHGRFYILCGLLAVTPLRRYLPAAFVIAVFVSAMASAYGALRWRFDERRFWIIGVLFVVWVGLAAWGPYRHTLYDLRDQYDEPVPVSKRPIPNANLIDGRAALQAWSGGRKKPLVVLAVDGGGIRAAAWVTSMLTALEKDIPHFPHHVRVIAGASGGMVGAAYYVATLQAPRGAKAVHAVAAGNPELEREDMIKAIALDSLESTTQRLIFRDIFPTPLWAYLDRGWVLERQWEENTGSLHMSMADLRSGEAEGWRPSLIFSPMIVEDGRRLLISNLDLADLTTTETGARPIPPSLSALEFAKLLPSASNLRLSTVARLSASFPYVTPAAEVPTYPLRRVVDAGYYDEHGVDLAASWLLANSAILPEYASKVVLIQIPDQRTEPNRLPNPCPRGWWSRGLADFVSPPQAIGSGWMAAQTFRNDQAVDLLSRALNAGGADYFRSYVFEPYKTVETPQCLYAAGSDWEECAAKYCHEVDEERPVALSWHIVTSKRDLLRDAPWTAQNCRARADLLQWWTDGAQTEAVDCEEPVMQASLR